MDEAFRRGFDLQCKSNVSVVFHQLRSHRPPPPKVLQPDVSFVCHQMLDVNRCISYVPTVYLIHYSPLEVSVTLTKWMDREFTGFPQQIWFNVVSIDIVADHFHLKTKTVSEWNV